jgi:hypothetical protein
MLRRAACVAWKTLSSCTFVFAHAKTSYDRITIKANGGRKMNRYIIILWNILNVICRIINIIIQTGRAGAYAI